MQAKEPMATLIDKPDPAAATSIEAARHAARPRARRRGMEPFLVLGGYLCLSILLYGRGVIGNLAGAMVGTGPWGAAGKDQGAFVWYLEWGARSIAHLRDPLSTIAIYSPHGWNLAWATSLPGPGALLTPLTLLAGPVVSFNLLDLCAPAFAAWTAYLLCREVLRSRAARAADPRAAESLPSSGTPTPGHPASPSSFTAQSLPAIAGGLLFGFGTYETVEMMNHVNLALVGLIPLAPLLVLRRHQARMSRGWLIVALGFLFAAQMLTSTELLATTVMFGTFAIALWAAFSDAQGRREIARTAAEALAGLVLAAALSAPFLFQAFYFGNPVVGISASMLRIDAANFLTPTRATLLPGIGGLLWSAHSLHSNITEQTGYLGLPLLVMLAAFAWSFRKTLTGRVLVIFMALTALLSLGGGLVIDGRSTAVPLPWALFAKLPLLRFAAPSRFPLFLWLAIGVAACLWLAKGAPRSAIARWALLALVAVSVMPSITGIRWSTPVDSPKLMSSPKLAKYVPPHSVVLGLPYGSRGNAMLWQVEAKFQFRMAGGYASFQLPPQYKHWKNLLHALAGRYLDGDFKPQLCRFLRYTKTTTILLRDKAPGMWHQLLGPLGIRPTAVGGFHVYQLATPSSSPGAPPVYESRLRCGFGGS